MNTPSNELTAAAITSAVDLLGKAYDNLSDLYNPIDICQARWEVISAVKKLDCIVEILRSGEGGCPTVATKVGAIGRLELLPPRTGEEKACVTCELRLLPVEMGCECWRCYRLRAETEENRG